MKWFGSWVIVGGCALVNSAACDLGHSCTDIGCADGFSVNVAPQTGVWQAGNYTLTLGLDEREASCDFAIPEQLPDRESLTSLDCIDGVDVTLQQRTVCTELHEGGSISLSCKGLPDQYELGVSAFQRPSKLTIELSRDAAVLLSEIHTLRYSENRPNGPDCGPVCRQATLDLAFED